MLSDARPEPAYGTQLQISPFRGTMRKARSASPGRSRPSGWRRADGASAQAFLYHHRSALRTDGAGHTDFGAHCASDDRPGLLEAIPEDAILARPIPRQGRRRHLRPPELGAGRRRPCTARPLRQESGQSHHRAAIGGSVAGDIGISSPLLNKPSGDCTEKQPACMSAMNGNTPPGSGAEINKDLFDLVVFYSRNLGVPARATRKPPLSCTARRVRRDRCASATCRRTRQERRPPTIRIWLISASGPIPTFCCTIWARALPTTRGPSVRRTAGNGERRRFGRRADAHRQRT